MRENLQETLNLENTRVACNQKPEYHHRAVFHQHTGPRKQDIKVDS